MLTTNGFQMWLPSSTSPKTAHIPKSSTPKSSLHFSLCCQCISSYALILVCLVLSTYPTHYCNIFLPTITIKCIPPPSVAAFSLLFSTYILHHNCSSKHQPTSPTQLQCTPNSSSAQLNETSHYCLNTILSLTTCWQKSPCAIIILCIHHLTRLNPSLSASPM